MSAPNKDDLLYDAWALICNASNRTFEEGGPVDASPGWVEAAQKWRDEYHALLKHQYAVNGEAPVDPNQGKLFDV